MTTDLDILLRDCDPARDVAAYDPDRARQLLDRATATDMPHPALTAVHNRSVKLLTAAAGVAGLAIAASVLTGVSSPSPANAGVSLERDGNEYLVTITDPERNAEQLTAAMHSYGFNIDLSLEPSSPSLVGSIVVKINEEVDGRATPSLAELSPAPCRASAGCKIGLRIPTDWTGKATIVLGRAARKGESYASSTSAFSPGEALACKPGRGMRAGEFLPTLREDGLRFEYRSREATASTNHPHPDWYVHEVIPASPGLVYVMVEAQPPPPAPTAPGC
jgi:hypothetical protein